jgi:hypothetical protein
MGHVLAIANEAKVWWRGTGTGVALQLSRSFLPGLNLVLAGPIAAALAGAGASAATGGVIGALIGAGIPEYRAEVYEAGLRSGGILLGVEAKSDEEIDKLEELLEALGGEHVRVE